MKILLLVLLSCIAVVINAKQHYVIKHSDNLNNTSDLLKSHAKNYGNKLKNNGSRIKYESRNVQEFAGGISSHEFEFVALVYNKVSQAKMGVALAVNKRWAVCSTHVIPVSTPRKDIRLYSNINEVSTTAMQAARRHRIKEMRRHPQENGNLNAIMLIRACPSFKSLYGFAGQSNQPVGTLMSIYNFMPTLQRAIKARAENCECDELPGWDKNLQICMTESDITYNTPTEIGSLLFIDGFLGIGITESSVSGESYTDLTKYKSWISSNTPEID